MDTYTWVNTTWITLQPLTVLRVKPLPKITGPNLLSEVQKQIKSEYEEIKFITSVINQSKLNFWHLRPIEDFNEVIIIKEY